MSEDLQDEAVYVVHSTCMQWESHSKVRLQTLEEAQAVADALAITKPKTMSFFVYRLAMDNPPLLTKTNMHSVQGKRETPHGDALLAKQRTGGNTSCHRRRKAVTGLGS